MVRCLPLWAIFMGFFSHFWLCTIIITYLPTYISTVLHVNIRDVSTLLYCGCDNNGCSPALPTIFQCIELFPLHHGGDRGSAMTPISQQWNWDIQRWDNLLWVTWLLRLLLCIWVLNRHVLLPHLLVQKFPPETSIPFLGRWFSGLRQCPSAWQGC
jgi:hypothetical protein